VKTHEACGLPAEEGEAEGVWINADPIPGCIVCNIGASEQSSFFSNVAASFNAINQCGRSGQTNCIIRLCIELFTEDRITGMSRVEVHLTGSFTDVRFSIS
jgi:hypothetical protein